VGILAFAAPLAGVAARSGRSGLQARETDGLAAIGAGPKILAGDTHQRGLDFPQLAHVAVDSGDVHVGQQVRDRFIPRVGHHAGKVLVVRLVGSQEALPYLVAQRTLARAQELTDLRDLLLPQMTHYELAFIREVARAQPAVTPCYPGERHPG
jgi:hypothetical protein